jgi:4-methyl-5(b-hydroxyethyl)-thiazole monophosphate biosynthesis
MVASKRILVPLAEGFEEIELAAIVDVLRRAGLEVTVASLAKGPVRGAHGMTLVPDAALADVDVAKVDVLVLPGGQPGTKNLAADPRVLDLVRKLHAKERVTAAICAAPTVLQAAGITQGVELTAHPSVRRELEQGGARFVEAPRVVRSGSIVTSQGPGTAIEFALALVAELVGAERSRELARGMVAAH